MEEKEEVGRRKSRERSVSTCHSMAVIDSKAKGMDGETERMVVVSDAAVLIMTQEMWETTGEEGGGAATRKRRDG